MTYLPNYSIQTQYFLYSLVLGLIVGVVYDVLRMLREGASYGRKPRFYITDIIIFIITAFLFEIFTLAYGYGKIRYYALLGMLLGFIFYINTFGVVTLKVEKGIAFFMNIPINFLIKTLKRFYLLLYNKFVILVNRLKMQRMGEESEKGEEEQ